jgi:hypothetical protein
MNITPDCDIRLRARVEHDDDADKICVDDTTLMSMRPEDTFS